LAAARAAAERRGLGRLARSEAALIEAPQCGQVSGADAGLVGMVVGCFQLGLSCGLRRIAGRAGIGSDVFGGSQNCLELSKDHDDKPGRVALEEVGDDLAGDLFGFLVTHGVAAAAGAGDVPAPGCGGQGLW